MAAIATSIFHHMDSFVDSLYSATPRPLTYLCGAVRKSELRLLIRLFVENRPRRSLEWGLGSGISAAAFGEARCLLALEGKHVVLDPFQQETSGGWGLRCLEEFDMTDSVEFSPLTSEEYLINARKSGAEFDFIFIDGAHDEAHKMMDAYMSLEVLAQDGIICFHDSFFCSTSSAITYLVNERGFRLLPVDGEPALKRVLRAAKHSPRMGWRFSCTLAPFIHHSIAALSKPR